MKHNNYTVKTLIEKLKSYPKDMQVFIDSYLDGELREIWDIREFYTESEEDGNFNCQPYSEDSKYNNKEVKVLVLTGTY